MKRQPGDGFKELHTQWVNGFRVRVVLCEKCERLLFEVDQVARALGVDPDAVTLDCFHPTPDELAFRAVHFQDLLALAAGWGAGTARSSQQKLELVN